MKQKQIVNIYALNIQSLDQGLELWRPLIDERRTEQACRFRRIDDRKRCIAAGLCLSWAAWQRFPEIKTPIIVERTPSGKPFAPDIPDFHFSISHSGNWAMCSESKLEHGVDIELIGENISGIINQVLTEEESAFLYSLAKAEQIKTLHDFWVIKESVMKATGKGLALHPQKISIQFNSMIEVCINGSKVIDWQSVLPEFADQNYCLGLAVKNLPGSETDAKIHYLRIEDFYKDRINTLPVV